MMVGWVVMGGEVGGRRRVNGRLGVGMRAVRWEVVAGRIVIE